MNSQKIIKGKLFLAVLVTMLCGMVAGGCSDDKDELEGKQYGYVQFKLYKSSSYTQEEKTRTDAVSTRASGLDKLIDAQKVEIEMQHNGMSITQTLVLNAYNENNAEYGMRSEKLKLLTGSYKIIGYKLFDKLDEVITGISTGEEETIQRPRYRLADTRNGNFQVGKGRTCHTCRRKPGHRLPVQRHKDYRCNGDQYIYTRTRHHQKSEGFL